MNQGSANEYPYLMGLGNDVVKMLRSMGPSETATGHFRMARIEVLKGFRQVLDDRISNLSHSQAKGSKVPVE